MTLVVPDSAVRVLFLDFDQLPTKAAEALPVVRFRLKKLLPFDADDAMVSYQVMSSEKGTIKLLAVAMPKAVLEEYEAVVLAAGYLPGAVLPSTLAALAGLDESAVARAGGERRARCGDDGDCAGGSAAAASFGGYGCECMVRRLNLSRGDAPGGPGKYGAGVGTAGAAGAGRMGSVRCGDCRCRPPMLRRL